MYASRTLFAIALALTALSRQYVHANTATVNGIKWTYTVSNGGASLGGGTSSSPAVPTSTSGEITIPSTLGGYDVTSIGKYAFYYCTDLTSVTIPDSVKSIGGYAFYGCSSITSLTIPDSVTTIGEYAFEACNGIISVAIPNSVTAIGKHAFSLCNSLTSVRISDGTPIIGDGMFYKCRGLTSVVIPNSVSRIGENAFEFCSSLISLTIPNSVSSIGADAFKGCNSLLYDTTTIPGIKLVDGWAVDHEDYASGDFDLTGIRGIADSAFSGWSSLVSVVIPSSVTNIAPLTFWQCYGLTSVTMYSSITNIGDCAFYRCDGLTSITIPDSVTSIGFEAFFLCSGLTSLTIPNSVTSIGEDAFNGCSGLSSVTIPNSVTNIGDGALAWCGNLTSVTIPSSVKQIRRASFANCSSLTSVIIPDSVTSIGKWAFSGCSSLTSVFIPDSVTNIESGAFSDCGCLRSVTIPNSVVSIGNEAFSGCNSLASINIPDLVTTIEEATFYGCIRLNSVTIPASVLSIGKDAFGGCSGLRRLTTPPFYRMCLKFPDAYTRITNAVVAPGVTTISTRAFEKFSNLKSVTIPDSVTEIGGCAFIGCTSLTSLMIPNSVTNIGSDVFSECSCLKKLWLPRRFQGKTTQMSIPSGCNVVFYDMVALQVSSNYGTATPEVGTHSYMSIETVNCATGKPEETDGIHYVCEGWTGTGSVPASGMGTNLSFAITEASTITWRWRKENSIKVSLTSGGFCDFGEQWVADGVTAEATIIPTTPLYTVSLSGEVEGVSLVGNTLIIPSDRPREIVVTLVERKASLDVIGEQGAATSARRTLWSWGDKVEACVTEPEPTNGISYVCTGWAGTGSVPASGTGTNVTFTIEEDSTLTWLWETNVWTECEVSGDANATPVAEWRRKDGEALVIPFSINSAFFGWSLVGDADGVIVDEFGKSITIPADRPRQIEARFVSVETAVGTGGEPVTWSGSIADWHPTFDANASDGSCLRSGATEANASSIVSATVSGSGRLSFDWRISAGRGDTCKFYVDGVEQNGITRSTSWATVSVNLGSGDHTLEWVYSRGSGSATGEDAAFLDNVDWRPNVTLAVASALGVPSPTAGTHSLVYGDSVSASVTPPEATNGIRRVCAGWTGTGSAPAHGTGTNVSFTITNDSSILWIWRTEYWTSVSVTGGTTAFTPQWVADGGTVSVEIVPSYHLYSISLSGDADGATLDGTTLRFVADGPRDITVSVEEVKVSLTVDSVFGVPTPTNGIHSLSYGDEVVASVVEPEPTNGVRYVCTGWTGTGSVPASGTGTNMTFTIAEDSSLKWNWNTNVLVSLAVSGTVTADFVEGWLEVGTNLIVQLSPTVPYYTAVIGGDTGGVMFDRVANTLTIPADRPRTVTLSVAELTLAISLDASNVVWATDGAAWFPQVAITRDGVDAAQSGQVIGDDVSGLETTLTGPGTLSWSWLLDSAGNAGVDLILDGEWLPAYEPTGEWTEETLEIGEGEHIVRFEFWNAGTAATIADCAYLDQVSWTPAASQTIVIGEVEVPTEWLSSEAATILSDNGGNYEATANAIAANGINNVWECFVAGISPTNAADLFRTVISIGADGAPVVGWEPDLNEGDTKHERVYTVEGKENLTDKSWAPTNSASRFFRVKVSMP